MKNITLSADEGLIERARSVARSRQTTLNEEFRNWLAEYAEKESRVERFNALMEQLSYVKSAGPYTRDEMNER